MRFMLVWFLMFLGTQGGRKPALHQESYFHLWNQNFMFLLLGFQLCAQQKQLLPSLASEEVAEQLCREPSWCRAVPWQLRSARPLRSSFLQSPGWIKHQDFKRQYCTTQMEAITSIPFTIWLWKNGVNRLNVINFSTLTRSSKQCCIQILKYFLSSSNSNSPSAVVWGKHFVF